MARCITGTHSKPDGRLIVLKYAVQAVCDFCGRSYRTYFDHRNGREALDRLKLDGPQIVQRDGKCYCDDICRRGSKKLCPK